MTFTVYYVNNIYNQIDKKKRMKFILIDTTILFGAIWISEILVINKHSTNLY